MYDLFVTRHHVIDNVIDHRNERAISVLKDWPKDNQDARFLRQVRDAACDVFSVVLSPDYNAAHRNHFHLDVGPWWVCR